MNSKANVRASCNGIELRATMFSVCAVPCYSTVVLQCWVHQQQQQQVLAPISAFTAAAVPSVFGLEGQKTLVEAKRGGGEEEKLIGGFFRRLRHTEKY